MSFSVACHLAQARSHLSSRLEKSAANEHKKTLLFLIKTLNDSKFLKLCKIETLEGKIFSSQESRLKVFILIEAVWHGGTSGGTPHSCKSSYPSFSFQGMFCCQEK